jgi:subfamily B ATP-binding cassette protein HlyB/CyaB
LTLPPLQGAIEFRNVTMRYRPDAADALRNVSLSIAAGEVIGVVGHSGSGKSTLTKLMQRLYSPQAGQVMIDGVDAAQLDPGWLRRQIGVVLQENILFNRTIHENIALGDPAMPRAMVMHAAKLAGADEFIAQLPQGYDTVIEERGANLSGGQRQRIAIARASPPTRGSILMRPRLHSLRQRADHPGEHARDCAWPHRIGIIAHRLAAVRPCSRIVGMRLGEIVGLTLKSAPREGGLYAHLWAMQSNARNSMNARVIPPAVTPPSPSRTPRVSGRDREFLRLLSKSSKRRRRLCRSR